MRIALFEPDIPQNAGAMMRTAACLGLACDVIGPTGFALSDRKLRRAGMDYLDGLDLDVHDSWDAFEDARLKGRAERGARLVALSTKAETSYLEFPFAADDILLVGRESAGLPDAVMAAADGSVRVPMVAGARSLNVAQALAMVLSEALRRTGTFPG